MLTNFKPINTAPMFDAQTALNEHTARFNVAKSHLERHPNSRMYAEDLPKEEAAILECKNALSEATAKLTDAIKEAEGRATARTITAEIVLKTLSEVENRLNIAKKYLKGVKVIANPNAQTFPRAYKYTAESTYFCAEHNGKAWKITNIYREECENTRVNIELTDDAKAAIIRNAERF